MIMLERVWLFDSGLYKVLLATEGAPRRHYEILREYDRSIACLIVMYHNPSSSIIAGS